MSLHQSISASFRCAGPGAGMPVMYHGCLHGHVWSAQWLSQLIDFTVVHPPGPMQCCLCLALPGAFRSVCLQAVACHSMPHPLHTLHSSSPRQQARPQGPCPCSKGPLALRLHRLQHCRNTSISHSLPRFSSYPSLLHCLLPLLQPPVPLWVPAQRPSRRRGPARKKRLPQHGQCIRLPQTRWVQKTMSSCCAQVS